MNGFRWTEDETGALLDITLAYKELHAADGIDWEQVITKYPDITEQLSARLAQGMEIPNGPEKRDFHAIPNLKIVSGKLKQIRHKYRRALSEGRRNGNGRAVAVFYDKCEQIWGGYPEPIIVGVGSIMPTPGPRPPSVISVASSSEEDTASTTAGLPTIACTTREIPENTPADTDLPSQVYWKIGSVESLAQPTQKRKLSTEEIAANHAEADLEIKRRLLDKLDEMNRRSEAQSNVMLATLSRMTAVLESLVQLQTQQPISDHSIKSQSPSTPRYYSQHHQKH